MFDPKEQTNRDVIVAVRVTERERAVLRRLAKKAQMTVSDYLRACIVNKLKKG